MKFKTMKFKEIKKFPHSSYSVDIEFKYLQHWLDGIKETNELELDPPYQRGHVWNQRQKESYIEYLLKGGMSSRDIYFNHPNWNTEQVKGPVKLEIVDGKQRLEAALGFMNNKVKAFDHYYNQYEDDIRFSRPGLKVHIATLTNNLDVLEWYASLNFGGTPHSDSEKEKVYGMIHKIRNDKTK
jgi:uncharacterized protein with ParB-like and HNH nuclease domain